MAKSVKYQGGNQSELENKSIVKIANKSAVIKSKSFALSIKSAARKAKSVSRKVKFADPVKKSSASVEHYVLPKPIPLKENQPFDRYKKFENKDVPPKSVTVKSGDNPSKYSPGYEMVKPTAGEKVTAPAYEAVKPSNKEIEPEIPTNENVSHVDRKPRSKRSKICMIGGFVVLALVLVALLVGAVVLNVEQSPNSGSEPLPNLNETCRNIKRAGNEKNNLNCVYHPNKYPITCKLANCSNMFIHWHKSGDHKLSTFDDTIDFRLKDSKIEDHTPCDKGKWCIQGDCESTDDERIKAYDQQQYARPVDANFDFSCDMRDSCIQINTSSDLPHDLTETIYNKIAQCVAKECVFNETEESTYQFAVRSCTKQYSLNGGRMCWDNRVDHSRSSEDANLIPIVVVNCSYCNKTEFSFPKNCAEYINGHPCSATTLLTSYTGICFLDVCIPFKDSKDHCS